MQQKLIFDQIPTFRTNPGVCLWTWQDSVVKQASLLIRLITGPFLNLVFCIIHSCTKNQKWTLVAIFALPVIGGVTVGLIYVIKEVMQQNSEFFPAFLYSGGNFK